MATKAHRKGAEVAKFFCKQFPFNRISPSFASLAPLRLRIFSGLSGLGKRPAFGLADPRVALAKIKQVRVKKDASQVQALIKAYHENAKRRDGYGLSIQISILRPMVIRTCKDVAAGFYLARLRQDGRDFAKCKIVLLK